MIESGVFPATAPRLFKALDARGIRWICHQDEAPSSAVLPPDACVLFWGSLGAAYEQRVARRWQPGAVGDPERFRCRSYYAPLNPWLANSDAVFTTVAELVRAPAGILSRLGQPSRVFVRPDSPLKPFAGRTLAVDALSLSALDHGYYYDDENLPIVVSTAKRIGREWRFVIAEGVVVASCEYDPARHGRPGEVPVTALALASQIANSPWQPAPLYIVDIATVDEIPRVMEINLFSGADLYDCDADAVVSAASHVAEGLHAAAGSL